LEKARYTNPRIHRGQTPKVPFQTEGRLIDF
jgi:hypothetical protein